MFGKRKLENGNTELELIFNFWPTKKDRLCKYLQMEKKPYEKLINEKFFKLKKFS